MRAYTLGTRRQLLCIYGSPGEAPTYSPLNLGLDLRPVEFWKPTFSAVTHESPFFGANLIAPQNAPLNLGFACGIRFDSDTRSYLVAPSRGRLFAGAVAEGSLQSFAFDANSQTEGFGPWITTRLANTGGILGFVEKTSNGFGDGFIKLSLRSFTPLQPANSQSFEGGASFVSQVCRILTVSQKTGEGETELAMTIIPGSVFTQTANLVAFRFGLGRDQAGNHRLSVIIAFSNGGGQWTADAISLPFARPSQDSTIFGRSDGFFTLPSSIDRIYQGTVDETQSSADASTLLIEEVDHDAIVAVSYRYGMIGQPTDLPNPLMQSTRRAAWEQSLLPTTLFTPTVRSLNASGQATNTSSAGTQFGSPLHDYLPYQGAAAEIYPASSAQVFAASLPFAAPFTDQSGTAPHANRFLLPRSDGFMHFSGKKFSTATIEIIGLIEAFTYFTFGGSVTWPESANVTAEEFARNSCKRMSVNQGNLTYVGMFLPPLGVFDCNRLIVNGVNSAAGMMRSVIQQCDVTETVPYEGATPTRIVSHTELFAFFSVGLQEAGTYVFTDPGEDPDSPDRIRARTILPNHPAGRIRDTVFYTAGNSPSPVIGVDLFAATLCDWSFLETTGTREGQTPSGLVQLGTAVFDSSQTQLLLSGETVQATDWLQGNAESAWLFGFPNAAGWGSNPPPIEYRIKVTLNVQ